MVQTIEAFVNRLQADGVEAGQAEAEKIRVQAEQQAQTRLAEATEEAKRIVAQAQADGETIRGRAETELTLAARDTVVRLQEALSRVLQGVLVDAVRGKLEDADFLGGLIRDVVKRYVEADAAGSSSIAVRVSEEMRQRLLSGTVAALRPEAPEAKQIDLRGTLAEAGFAYEIAGGTVEVTVDSVVEVLSEMVGAELRKRVAAAAVQAS
jgi:V/A-type H+/Na+-transporting ATPase subunit E